MFAVMALPHPWRRERWTTVPWGSLPKAAATAGVFRPAVAPRPLILYDAGSLLLPMALAPFMAHLYRQAGLGLLQPLCAGITATALPALVLGLSASAMLVMLGLPGWAGKIAIAMILLYLVTLYLPYLAAAFLNAMIH